MKKVFLSVSMILTVFAVQACDTGGPDFTKMSVAACQGEEPEPFCPPPCPSGLTCLRFTDNGNGTITDNLTGFLWTKDAGCLEDTTWEETLETASTIGAGDCGLTDGSQPGSWNVPYISELLSLVDYDNSPPSPAHHPFVGIDDTTVFWTSDTNTTDQFAAYILDFGAGEVLLQPKGLPASSMLVCILQGGPAGSCAAH